MKEIAAAGRNWLERWWALPFKRSNWLRKFFKIYSETGVNTTLIWPDWLEILWCTFFGLRSHVDKLSELNTEMSSFWNLDHGNTWICERTGWPEFFDDGRLLRQCSLSDPRVPMVQILKGRYLCAQVTGLIYIKPGPKKTHSNPVPYSLYSELLVPFTLYTISSTNHSATHFPYLYLPPFVHASLLGRSFLNLLQNRIFPLDIKVFVPLKLQRWWERHFLPLTSLLDSEIEFRVSWYDNDLNKLSVQWVGRPKN